MKQKRNEKCKCGSGLKYKKCCIATDLFASIKADNILTFTDGPKENRGNLISFAAFYKENTPQGFGITFAKKGTQADGYGIVLNSETFYGLYDSITKCNEGFFNGIKNGHDDKNEVIKYLTKQIEYFLPILWKKLFNTKEYPGKSYRKMYINLTDSMGDGHTLGTILMLFISNVMVLTELGAIENDNFNGPNLTYLKQ